VEIDAARRQRGARGVTVELVDLSSDGLRASTHLITRPAPWAG
jgi:hypothetical protein